uniref:Uncharacterized protein n=1 Tax=Eutreptiella gymnastica TaxID=73025 RepID=A0A7S4D1Y5_9EUGL
MMPVTTCAAQVLLTRFTASTKRQVQFDDEGLHIPLFSVEYQLPLAAVKYEEDRVQRCGGSGRNSGIPQKERDHRRGGRSVPLCRWLQLPGAPMVVQASKALCDLATPTMQHLAQAGSAPPLCLWPPRLSPCVPLLCTLERSHTVIAPTPSMPSSRTFVQ